MSKPAWTPGPWRVEDPLGPDILSIVSNPDGAVYEWGHVAQISISPEDDTDIPATEAKANAHLIAAAPKLYEALDEAINYLAVYASTMHDGKAAALLNKCTAAMADATGET